MSVAFLRATLHQQGWYFTPLWQRWDNGVAGFLLYNLTGTSIKCGTEELHRLQDSSAAKCQGDTG